MRARSTSTVLIVAALVVATFAFPAAASATDWWVSPSHGNNAYPGNMASPFRTIDGALAHAVSGDRVMLMPGTYQENAEQSFPIVLTPGVTIQSQDDAHQTIITGDGSSDVIRITNATAGTRLVRLTIAGGGVGVSITRTAVPAAPGWPEITGCVIEQCGSYNSSTGGGLYAEGVAGFPASPRIEHTTFRSNVADEGGGAYLGVYTEAFIQYCTFENNTVYRGGGICTRTQGNLTVYDSLFADNAAGVGGGLAADAGGGELVLNRCEIRDNTASSQGGGLHVVAYNPIYNALEIVRNSAPYGGGTYHNSANPTLGNCLVAGNIASTYGSAAYSVNGTYNVYNCTVADNTGGSWRGIWADGGATVEVYNSILWGNGGQDVRGAAAIAYTDTQDTNLADDMNSGIANVMHADPLLLGYGDYRLTSASPCIDAADPGLVVEPDAFGNERPIDGDRNGSAVPDMGYHEFAFATLSRLWGADRYATAVDIIDSGFSTNDYAVVASGANYPDALSASGLAGVYRCPLLLVGRDSVPTVVSQKLASLGVQSIYIVGGTAAVSSVVEQQLDLDYHVERISGGDRYATAAEVAKKIVSVNSYWYTGRVFLARGDSFPDALALSPLSYYACSYADGVPILLTRPTALPAPTIAAMSLLDVDHGFVAGGASAVSDATKAQFDSLLVENGGVASQRWSGTDRYATARAIAEWGSAEGFGQWRRLGIATGTNFPDALVGGAALGDQHGLLLLARPDSLPPASQAALEAHAPDVRSVHVLGGEGAVSYEVGEAVRIALGMPVTPW